MGEILAFCASLTWAMGTSVYGKLTGKYPALTINLSRALISFPLFVIAAGFEIGSGPIPIVGLERWIWFSVSVICSIAVGDWIFLLSTVELGISLALAIASCYPIWSALFGVFFKNEMLSHLQWIGLITAVAGIVYVILLGRKKKEAGKNQTKGLVLAVLCSFFWALNSIAVAQAGKGLPSAFANTIRMGLAVVFCLVLGIAVFRVRPLKLQMTDYRKYGWMFAFEAFFGSFSYVYGVSHTPLAIGSVLTSLAPAIAVPLAWMTGQEKVSIRKLVGISVIIGGLILLVVRG